MQNQLMKYSNGGKIDGKCGPKYLLKAKINLNIK
jgi:hypothetical protein